MTFLRFSLTFITLCLVNFFAKAQLNLPVKKLNGQDYYYYTVKSKETIYGISHKLKISQEDILKYNPTALSGLKDKQMLFFPVADFSNKEEHKLVDSVAIENNSEFTHIVEPGETLYGLARIYNTTADEILAQNPEAKNGIKSGQLLRFNQKKNKTLFVTIKPGNTLFSTAKKYNTTIADIMSENPGISPSNFKAGEVIRITPNSAKPIEKEREVTKFYPYEIKSGDTFSSIAANNNISTDELKSANPNTDKLKKGKFIYIPVKKTETILVAPNQDSENTFSHIESIYNDVHIAAKDSSSINVALILPFMLKENTPNKTARLFTEFYKGFLLAVNELKEKTDKRINIYAYDSEGSIATVRDLLEKEEMKKMDIVFAPDNNSQISAIAEFGKANNINVVNTFSTKNESYLDNPRVFHLNVPNVYMNLKVLNMIDSNFPDYDIVFLNNAQSESKEITAQIKAHVKGRFTYHEFDFSTVINAEELSASLLQSRKYLFIPNSSSKKDLFRIMPALLSIKNERSDIEIALFGYPEWITYLNSCSNDLHKIDTYFYSRFFTDSDDSRLKDFDKDFKNWYGENMISAAPQFGLLGYDTGRFFLKSYIDGNTDFTSSPKGIEGIQTDFLLERSSNWSGFINKAVYFIHFTPYNTIDRTIK